MGYGDLKHEAWNYGVWRSDHGDYGLWGMETSQLEEEEESDEMEKESDEMECLKKLEKS